MGRAVRVDEDGVGDVLDDAGAGERLGGPAGDGLVSAAAGCAASVARSMVRGLVGEDPEGVFGGGIVVGWLCFDPVDGGEDDEVVVRAVEVDPEQAARGAEVDDAAGDGDVAVVVGEDFAGDGEVVERGVGERAVLAV